MAVKKRYIGDGVYASDDGFYLILTTEDGIRATNTIFLEPEVAVEVARYMTEFFEHRGFKKEDILRLFMKDQS